jgi:hypothetical protein
MNAIIREAAERRPPPSETADRVFLHLSDGWALGYDRVQWMIMRRWKNKEGFKWQPVSFIGSNKSILRRCLREDGAVITPEAEKALGRLPDTFREWLAQREAGEHPSRREAA